MRRGNGDQLALMVVVQTPILSKSEMVSKIQSTFYAS